MEENQELAPLKKYLLIQKLEFLKTQLEKHNIDSTSLKTFLKFSKNFSYDTILSMTKSFVEFFENEVSNAKG
jgi:hypothetical protein